MYRSIWNRQPEAGVGCSICDSVISHDPTGYAFCAETWESLSGASCRMRVLLIIACMGLLLHTVHFVLVARWVCISAYETDVNNSMNSVDMLGVSTPVLPVTVFSVMEPVVTLVTLGTAYGCAVTESCCSP